MQGDPAMMEALVGQLMSPDNSARQGAEGSFQKMKDHVPEICVLGLVRVLRQSPQADSRTFSAVLLRKVGFAAQVLSSSPSLACTNRNNAVRCMQNRSQIRMMTPAVHLWMLDDCWLNSRRSSPRTSLIYGLS